jgi:hypothetical protein
MARFAMRTGKQSARTKYRLLHNILPKVEVEIIKSCTVETSILFWELRSELGNTSCREFLAVRRRLVFGIIICLSRQIPEPSIAPVERLSAMKICASEGQTQCPRPLPYRRKRQKARHTYVGVLLSKEIKC